MRVSDLTMLDQQSSQLTMQSQAKLYMTLVHQENSDLTRRARRVLIVIPGELMFRTREAGFLRSS